MSVINYQKPVLGIAAFSGTGKTQLLTQLIPALKQSGLRVGVIKHAHHDVDIDKPGKDSYQIRMAGATPVVLASDKRIAVMIEKNEASPSTIDDLLSYIKPETVDLVLIEGYKELDHAKLFLFRHNIKDRYQEIDEASLRIMNNDNTLAIVTDIKKSELEKHLQTDKTILDINNIDDVKHFILEYLTHHTINEI